MTILFQTAEPFRRFNHSDGDFVHARGGLLGKEFQFGSKRP
jgi:hypothetical protein